MITSYNFFFFLHNITKNPETPNKQDILPKLLSHLKQNLRSHSTVWVIQRINHWLYFILMNILLFD